jgi:hypothetical protein
MPMTLAQLGLGYMSKTADLYSSTMVATLPPTSLLHCVGLDIRTNEACIQLASVESGSSRYLVWGQMFA